MSRLIVQDGGFLTTVQDGGRAGWMRYGIPPSGALDEAALRAANGLVGNPAGAAALEVTLSGPVLVPTDDRLLALCGADFEWWAGNRPLPTWHACRVRPGEVVTIGARRWGARGVLAISGGIALAPFLGSQATYLPGAFGGLEGRALRAGDSLPLGPAAPAAFGLAGAVWAAGRPAYPAAGEPVRVRVVPGPQAEAFTPAGLAAFWEGSYMVAPASDRMGCRLQGPVVERAASGEMVSDGVVTGSIQIPPDGQPIVMLADHQTTGGYPKVGTVIRADWPLLAQCLPGERLRFEPIEPAAAQAIWRAVRAAESRALEAEPESWGE